ncbi:MarR family transcriptional regulator [Streptomyces europaeiscabiei]|uniref:MarR family winged helix-turn-helix transcriptional regulator n=1 Tax=Streptomyces TaxID=1883 RepID=UPI000A3611FE|nr:MULTISPECIES: MarR family transcriptional regulator [Streptomyces]MDX3585456.1 MarR family transcriptional regulator [Streptomyces europaeiscabiei]MDX3633252.1 MarR family transcriptional regulator [Streptomyces europaeiscabiei]MDX3650842.1 MarR family transcriptional regulator [Streptomyces europaeiscabiei]WUD30403.1 MarR family transcriptional regulator [Streptomyces europaeiscabiei]
MTGPHDFDQQLLDAVENLVPLWFSAVEDVTPRLSPRQILALRAVRRRPELNLTALAEQLGVGLPTASRLCDRLEAAGLLQRCVRHGDRREVRLVVTERGHGFLADVTERLSGHLTDALATMSPAERARVEQVLRILGGIVSRAVP